MSGEEGGGPLDLNGNGSGLDEIVFFAAVSDANERRRRGLPPRGCGCLLPVAAIVLAALFL
jgi:hypothetical protein